jgi:WD40 repeat protein
MNSVQMSVAFSPDGQMIAASGWYGATVWKIDGTWHKTLTGWEAVSAVTFSPDGKMIAGARDKTVKLWQIDSKLLQTKNCKLCMGIVMQFGCQF